MFRKARYRKTKTKAERQRLAAEKEQAAKRAADAEQQKRILTEAIIEALSSPTRSWRMRVVEIPLADGKELWARAEHISAITTDFAHNRTCGVILSSGDHYQAESSAYEVCKLIDPSCLRERWTRREHRFATGHSFISTEARPPEPPPPLPKKARRKRKTPSVAAKPNKD